MAETNEEPRSGSSSEWEDRSEYDREAELEAALEANEANLARARQSRFESMISEIWGTLADQDIVDRIPQTLYEKAWRHQSDLTDSERTLLLSRGDLIGQILANPASISMDDCYRIIGWPAPDLVRSRIQAASSGTLNEPMELYAKARSAIQRGTLHDLSDAEIGLIANSFHDKEGGRFERKAGSGSIPGASEASNLMSGMQGADVTVWASALAVKREREPTLVAAVPLPPEFKDSFDFFQHHLEKGTLEEWWRQNNIHPPGPTFVRPENTIADVNLPKLPEYQPPWPTMIPQRMLKRPWTLLLADLINQRGEQVSKVDLLPELPAQWAALTDDQRAVYEAHSELLRQQAWAQLEAETRAGKRKYDIFY